MRRFRDEVETFLIREARDDSNDRLSQMLRWQAEQIQQRLLADVLAAQILCRISRGDDFVAFGTPSGVIDAIQDAHQAVGAAAHHTVESVAELASLNLLRVFAADGGQVVGKNQATLEKINAAEKLDPRGMKHTHGNTGAV